MHLRELARLTGTQPGTLRRELRLLVGAGVVCRERLGNLTLYRADPTCVIHDELRAILLKTTGNARFVRAALTPLRAGISVAYLREPPPGQGVEMGELVVVGSVGAEAVRHALDRCPPTVRETLHVLVRPPPALRKKARKKDSALTHALSGPKLFLFGGNEDLWRLAERRREPEGG